MGNKKFKRSEISNSNTYNFYYDKLCELKLTVFSWEGLPDTVDPIFMELKLLETGQCLFFKDEVVGYLTLPFTGGTLLNQYGLPTNRNAESFGYYYDNLNENNSVIIYNNYMRTNDLYTIQMYASKLALIQNAIDINIKLQKTPKILKVPENMRLTLENLLMDYSGNIPFLLGENNLDQITVSSLDLTAPYIADQLQNLLSIVWNEALKNIGVISYIDDKKERNIEVEVNNKLGDANAIRYSMLAPRQLACKQINKLFGLNISVEPSINQGVNYNE